MSSIRRKLQITFVTGLLVIIPIAGSRVGVRELISFVDRLLDPFVGGLFPFHLPGLGLFVAILLVLLMGIVATNVVGRRILGGWTAFLLPLPIFRSVYFAVKQLLKSPFRRTIRSPSRNSCCSKIVEGHYCFGFLTGAAGPAAGQRRERIAVGRLCPHQPLVLGDILLGAARGHHPDPPHRSARHPDRPLGRISIPQVLRQEVSSRRWSLAGRKERRSNAWTAQYSAASGLRPSSSRS